VVTREYYISTSRLHSTDLINSNFLLAVRQIVRLSGLMRVWCRYAGDAVFQVSVRGLPAGIKDVQVTDMRSTVVVVIIITIFLK